MRLVKLLFVCHLAALVFALGGLLIVLPHPEWWNTSAFGVQIFEFVLRYAGALHILFGAATMLLFGLLCVGARKTLIFFAASTIISLSIELLSINTGLPFGAASYPTFAGFKVAGLVPYSIPLFWFYMGFTSYLLASALTPRLRLQRQTLWSLILGSYFLTAWALALDAGVAGGRVSSPTTWPAYGSYFGMPMRNLFAWVLLGLIFMGVSRLLWRTNLDTHEVATWLPFGVYLANTGFVMALNLGEGLWFPLFMSALFILLPEALVLVPDEDVETTEEGQARALLSQSVWLIMRGGSRFVSRRRLEMQVEGQEYVQRPGPMLIAARHFHFFYDGYILLRTIPRRLHTIVSVDWLQVRPLRPIIEFACSLADWPVILRSEQFQGRDESKHWAYAPNEVRRYLRRVTRDAARLLRAGEVLVIFPEGYPNVDPHPTPKSSAETILPFRAGFTRLIEHAERDGQTRVAIIPAGLSYRRVRGERWRATVRFGPPLYRSDFANSEQLLHAVEEQVRALSQPILPVRAQSSSRAPGGDEQPS